MGGGRERAATTSVATVERCAVQIAELMADLDTWLRTERRRAERLRMLRETANRITRTANDGIEAYRSASRVISNQAARSGGDAAAVEQVRERLGNARVELLGVLAIAWRRYPTPQTEPATDRARP